jgi:hypothetical protein
MKPRKAVKYSCCSELVTVLLTGSASGLEAYCSEEDEGRDCLLCACHDGQLSGRLSR